MNWTQAILYLYPDAIPMKDFIVQDNSDGKGPFIPVWKLKAAKPTSTEIQTAWQAYEAEQAAKPVPTDLRDEKIAQLESLVKILDAQQKTQAETIDFLLGV